MGDRGTQPHKERGDQESRGTMKHPKAFNKITQPSFAYHNEISLSELWQFLMKVPDFHWFEGVNVVVSLHLKSVAADLFLAC